MACKTLLAVLVKARTANLAAAYSWGIENPNLAHRSCKAVQTNDGASVRYMKPLHIFKQDIRLCA